MELLKLMPCDPAAESANNKKPNESKKRVTPTHSRLHLTISNRALAKLSKLLAMQKLSFYCGDEAIEYAMDVAIGAIEKSHDIVKAGRGAKGRAIPMAVKKHILKRAKHVCELEFEHVVPYALGGGHEAANLKLYCRAHNQRAAIVSFGQGTMDRYLNNERY